jgi:hypothetical protein
MVDKFQKLSIHIPMQCLFIKLQYSRVKSEEEWKSRKMTWPGCVALGDVKRIQQYDEK